MIGVIASVTLKRLLRGRAFWISAIIAAVPVVFTSLLKWGGRDQLSDIHDVLAFTTLLLIVLPAMFLASSVGEDIEDRTITYVWSRPVPRGAVLAGKLLALAPIAATLVTTAWIAAAFIGTGTPPPVLSIVAFVVGTFVVCIVATTIATLVPKHGMPLMIAYMLFFDFPVGVMPISLSKLSVTHQLHTLSGVVRRDLEAPNEGAIGLAILAAVWLGIAMWRVRRMEA